MDNIDDASQPKRTRKKRRLSLSSRIIEEHLLMDPLFILDLAKAPSAILSQQVAITMGKENVNFAYGTNPAFPDHDRLLIINMGTTECGLRICPMEAKKYFEGIEATSGSDTRPIDVLKMGMKPNSTSAPPLYFFNLSSALPGAQLYVDVQQFHVVGSPLRLARFVSSMILNPNPEKDIGEEEKKEAKKEKSGEETSTEKTKEEKIEEKKRFNSAVERFFQSVKNDLQGKHMVFQFSYDLSIVSKDSKSVFINLTQTKTEHNEEGERVEATRPTFVFQNVYFLHYLLQTIRSVSKIV